MGAIVNIAGNEGREAGRGDSWDGFSSRSWRLWLKNHGFAMYFMFCWDVTSEPGVIWSVVQKGWGW